MKPITVALALAMATATSAAWAALKPGDAAPDFSTEAAVGGKPFRFSLAEALQRGPVVLYFFPKAFTTGCTIEAHEFAEATPRFAELGATVVGVSTDDLPTLQRFSVEACRDKFAVASDADGRIVRQYDAKLPMFGNTADRVSYVISPAGRVVFTFSSLSPQGHVTQTLEAVRRLQAESKK
jgi:peroxiredoxin